MDIGNKGGPYAKANCDNIFDIHYLVFCTHQMSLVISDIQCVCKHLEKWALKAINAKKLDVLSKSI